MNQNGILVDLYSIDFFDFPHTLGLATSGKWWFSLYLLCSAHWNLSYSLLSVAWTTQRHDPTQCAQVRARVVSKRDPVFRLAALIPYHPSVS